MRSSRASASAARARRAPARRSRRPSRRSPPRGRGRRRSPLRARRRSRETSADAEPRGGGPMRANAEIGLSAPQSDQQFSLREAARILEVPEARLRALARAGFLAPQRGPVGPLSFGFRDLLLLRTTKGLLES